MGTSASSKGPNSGVSLVPPWVGPAIGDAQPVRFGGARVSLGNYARSGSLESMKRGLGHYATRGVGGKTAGTARFRKSAQAAGTFADVFRSISAGGPLPTGVELDLKALVGRSQQHVADAVVAAVIALDGSQDSEASRDSAARAISDLLDHDPNADLLALSDDQIEYFYEHFLANELVTRIELDVGASIFDKAPNAAAAMTRVEQIKQFIQQEFFREIRALKTTGQVLTAGNGKTLASAAIRATLEIFEGWIN